MLNTSRWLAVWVAVVLLATLTPGGARASGASGSSIYIGPDWCAVGGSVNIRWQIGGGAPPYTVSVAGIVAETDEEHLTLSCAVLRAWVTDGVLRQHVEVVLPVRVVDANETEAAARLTMLLLGAAPQEVPQDIDLFVGYSDVHVRTLSFMPASEWRLAPSVVLIRYRPLGAVAWAYAMPFPWGPQSGRYALPSHISDLTPGTLYELQAAWVWFLDTQALPTGAPGWEEPDDDHWWRKWNDAQEISLVRVTSIPPGRRSADRRPLADRLDHHVLGTHFRPRLRRGALERLARRVLGGRGALEIAERVVRVLPGLDECVGDCRAAAGHAVPDQSAKDTA